MIGDYLHGPDRFIDSFLESIERIEGDEGGESAFETLESWSIDFGLRDVQIGATLHLGIGSKHKCSTEAGCTATKWFLLIRLLHPFSPSFDLSGDLLNEYPLRDCWP